MNRPGLSVLFFLLSFAAVYGQSNPYAVQLIPPGLREQANATVRDESIQIDMRSMNNMTIHISRSITIHNNSGDPHGSIEVYYNKARNIRNIRGKIMDESGNTIQQFSLRDFNDISASGQGNLYDDNRMKTYRPVIHIYPYTISYEIEIRENQNLLIPRWAPDYSYDVSVQRSTYSVTLPKTEEIRIHEMNYQGKYNLKEDSKTKSYTWTLIDVAAKRSEAFSPPRNQRATFVRIVPQHFQYYRKKGSFTDWYEYGKWMYEELLADKKILPPATVSHIKSMTAEAESPQEKARILYKYLQEKTRYISIQIGIGGFEPFPAATVDQLGYGDCKALVIYMQSMLEVVGIPSYYCVVEAGNFKQDMTAEFANMSDGNHVILCIPFANDTTWLECTSRDLPYGYLGDFTDDRIVVACTENGGRLMRTPKYGNDENMQYREARFAIDQDGSLQGTMETLFKGNQLENHLYNIKQNLQDQRKNLIRWYNIDGIGFDQVNYDISSFDSITVRELVGLRIKNYIVHTDNFMILQPNIFNSASTIPASRNRSNPVFINRGYTDIDIIRFEIPEGYSPVLVPVHKMVTTPMFEYELKMGLDNGVLTSFRSFQLKEGIYPAASYQQFYDAMAEIQSYDGIRYNIPRMD